MIILVMTTNDRSPRVGDVKTAPFPAKIPHRWIRDLNGVSPRMGGPVFNTGANGRLPGFLRNIKLPVIPEVTSAEHDNPAFEHDPPDNHLIGQESLGLPSVNGTKKNRLGSSSSLSSLVDLSLAKSNDNIERLSISSDAPPPGDLSRRKSSIADIAMAITAPTRQDSLLNLMQLAAPHRFRRGKFQYVHPYGNTMSIVDELFPVEDAFSQKESPESTVSGSMAKVVIWIVFALFMVGVAAAIILGAEAFDWDKQSVQSSNGSTYYRTSAVYYSSRRRYSLRRY